MRSQKKSAQLLGLSIVLAVVLFLFGPLGLTGTAHAASDFILVTFTNTSPTNYTDLSGNSLGDVVHVGELLCVGNVCSQKIEVETTETVVYKFKTLQAFDASANRVVVGGTGTTSSDGQKTKFAFTATFEDNGDGTVWVRYETSAPGTSFIFPRVPGTFSVFSNN